MADRSDREAREFLASSEFVWHQRFDLGGGVYTPGINDVEWLASASGLPEDLTGKSVLDVGTTNGWAAFEAERRGASRVLATDVLPADWFGFDRMRAFWSSSVEFRQVSVYELAGLEEQFDVVIFWGVLYHLRHPLLGIDSVRALTRELLLLETAVSDNQLHRRDRYLPLARFYRRGELNEDPSNWFAPTVAAVLAWCESAGIEAQLVSAWPRSAPTRCIIRGTPYEGDPEFAMISYERPLRTSVIA